MRSLKILNQLDSYKNLNKQLEKYTKNKQTKLSGDIFELVVKLFLQTNPKYNETRIQIRRKIFLKMKLKRMKLKRMNLIRKNLQRKFLKKIIYQKNLP